MRRYLLLSATALLLTGCQTQNPYQADSIALPPTAASAADFDVTAYPDTTINKTYTYWCWQHQYAISATLAADQTMQRILAEQLEQYGLRPARNPKQCEFKVQLSSQHSQRIHRDNDAPTAPYGISYSSNTSYDPHRYSGVGAHAPITQRRYTEYYQQLTLTFRDDKTNKLIWSTQSTVNSNQNSYISEDALRKAFDSMLESYHQQP